MLRNRALLVALDLASMPALATQARQQPVPDGVLDVIRIAAGCKETLEEAATQSGKEPRFVKAAAEFYIQQVLLFSTADNYRILGVRSGAPREQMRTHMRWLMTWLHPDRAQADWQTVFARRVLAAWREAGSAPAAANSLPAAQKKWPSRPPHRVPWVPRPIETRRGKILKPSLALAAIIVAIALITPSGLVEAWAVGAASWIMTALPGANQGWGPDFSRGTHDLAPAGSASNRPDG